MKRIPKTTPRRLPGRIPNINFPTEITEKEIDNQTKKLTDIIRYNATLFFGQTEATKKRAKAGGVKT